MVRGDSFLTVHGWLDSLFVCFFLVFFLGGGGTDLEKEIGEGLQICYRFFQQFLIVEVYFFSLSGLFHL